MSGGVWVTESGGVVYNDKTALGYRRHDEQSDGRGRVFWTGGVEAGKFLGINNTPIWGGGVPVVVDDFGDLVQVLQ